MNVEDHFGNLARINENLNIGVMNNYRQLGLRYVDVPAIVGITGACENVDTLYKVQNRFDIPLFFTQTGQLSLEQALQTFSGVYAIIHSGRDEEEEDARHLRQFRLTEEEFDCTMIGMNRNTYDEDKMFDTLLSHVQKAIQAMIHHVIEENGKELEKAYHRDIGQLKNACQRNFFRIEYDEAIKLLNKQGFRDLSFGDDLKAEHEAKIIELLNKGKSELPVFIIKYPKEIKFFNMKVYTKNPRVVLSADLIFPYAGEGTGSAVREHDFHKLNERLLTSNMYRLHVQRGGVYEDFAWYLNIIKNQLTNPHAGYGIGNERVLQYIFGEKDIRNVSLFSLLNKQTGDWSREKYGRASIVSSEKKHILISAGPKDKKSLLPLIKRLAKQKDFVLYATRKTHQFLAKNRVKTSMVYKVSEIGQSPNIADLLSRRMFDLIINIPTHKDKKEVKELTDGKIIRQGAQGLGITLINSIEEAKKVIDNLSCQPFYDPKKTYQENYDFGPFISLNEKKFVQRGQPEYKFLGKPVYSTFGIPAGPLLNSKFIKMAFEKGFDIAVYKTVRTEYFPTHPFPNIVPVKVDGDLTISNAKKYPLFTDPVYKERMTITNSFGVPSKEPHIWQADVKKALTHEKKGQLLILSFMGTVKENQTESEFIKDYILAGKLAAETGARVLEVNFSCPNRGAEGLVYQNLDLTERICRGIRKVIGNIPLILKIGYVKYDCDLVKLSQITDEYANAISAINTIPAKLYDKYGNQALPGKMRISCGICGDAIRWAGVEMARRMDKARKKFHFKYEIIGVGGVIRPEDYWQYKKAGADCVMSATGAMWNPNLAQEIKKQL